MDLNLKIYSDSEETKKRQFAMDKITLVIDEV